MLKITFAFLIALFILHEPTAEQVSINFMKKRYFNPLEAYELTSKEITQSDFMRRHEQMLRIKDYELENIISFKIKKSTNINDKTKEVVITTTRPNIQKIFAGFYLEKVKMKNLDSTKIKKIIKQRLEAKNAPTEDIDYSLTLVKEVSGWKVIKY